METLTQWSRQQATDAQVSDVYVRLGYEFNIACRAFTAINVETSDLGNVPELLRNILESTLSQEASVESLDKYLPRIRDIIINLLHGLKRKQQKLRQRQMRELSSDQSLTRNISAISGASASTGLSTLLDQGLSDNSQKNEQGRPFHSTNDIGIAHKISSSSARRPTPVRDQENTFTTLEDPSLSDNPVQSASVPVSSYVGNDMTVQSRSDSMEKMANSFPPPPPPPPPKIPTNALAALQRGGELERRASKRYSHYQISKHLGASPNGVPLLPQNSPIPNRGRSDTLESIKAVQNRDQRNTRPLMRPANDPLSSRPSSRITEHSRKSSSAATSLTEEDKAGTSSPEKFQQSTDEKKSQSMFADAISRPTGHTQKQTAVIKEKDSELIESNHSKPIAPSDRQVSSRSYQSSSSKTTSNGKELTLFLQYKTKVRKFLLPGGHSDLSIARLQLGFIEKFAWNTHHNGVDLPEIYIQDPVSGVRHELEELSDVKDGSVLVLNIEALDEVKRHIDEGLSGIKNMVEGIRTAVDDQQATIKRVSDCQQDTVKEISRIQTSMQTSSRDNNAELLSGNFKNNPKKVNTSAQQREVQAIRRDLAVIRQTYSVFQSDVQNSMNFLRKTAENIKAAAVKTSLPDMNGDSGRCYVNIGKKGLDEDSDNLVARVDDLQDMVEDLRKDVVLRGVRPLPRQLESVGRDISQATMGLKKMQDFLKRERPIWTKIWEKELERVCKDREDLTLVEDLIVDLEDDLSKASQTFALVKEATKEQLKDPPGSTSAVRAISRGLTQITASDPISAKEEVLDEVRALQPNHKNRLEAIERAEKLRHKELERRRKGEFERELSSFVEEGKLKKSGGFEEVERARQVKDQKIRTEVWESQNSMTQASCNIYAVEDQEVDKDEDEDEDEDEYVDEGEAEFRTV